jgi:hypothetical protein
MAAPVGRGDQGGERNHHGSAADGGVRRDGVDHRASAADRPRCRGDAGREPA